MKRDDFIRIGGILLNKAHVISAKVHSSVVGGRYVEIGHYDEAVTVGAELNLHVLLSTSVGDFECLRFTKKLDDVKIKRIKTSLRSSPFDSAVDARDEFLEKTKEIALAEADFLERKFFEMLESGEDIQANKVQSKI